MEENEITSCYRCGKVLDNKQEDCPECGPVNRTEIIKKPVILVSHLSRQFAKEKRDPIPSDLHWSSNIEKNANTVILLTRWTEEYSDKTLASTKIIIWKNRSGLKCPTVMNACFNIWTKEYMKWKEYNHIDVWF